MTNPAQRGPYGPAYGELLGSWRVLEPLGVGTYGSVYRAALADRPEAREYALKLAYYADDARFEREAEVLSRIRHPNVPRYHDRGVWQDSQGRRYPYVVMQRAEGVPLYDWAKAHGITNRQALQVLAQVARALEATHQHGLHRDVKGDNVLMDREGRVMLVDFGLAFHPEARPVTDTVIPPGTEPYRSPQLLRFRYDFRLDGEAYYRYRPEDDLYALGVTAYRLVTGTYPPPGTDPECEDDPQRPRPVRRVPPSELASVCPELEKLILRMLSEKPEARGTAGELAQALEEAAKSLGRAGGVAIRPAPSMVPTERAKNPGPRPKVTIPSWLMWAGASMVGGLVVAVGMELLRGAEREPTELRPSIVEVVQEPAARVDETVGLADAGVEERVFSTSVGIPQAGGAPSVLALPFPRTPVPGQKKPPCDPRSEHLILGACWTRIDMKPPCGASAYEFDGKCVLPSVITQRSPTSDPP
ncbi:serine/threonine protein kinase [Hyalangium versicolor]|uniref:serine/threonine protein kinase n=1 Tax=Hyalangium versicolor TaxID=2861190 RepID=UPI001CCE342B|nr:serine/threonine-protein kinase [Hyalangium versicolor]